MCRKRHEDTDRCVFLQAEEASAAFQAALAKHKTHPFLLWAEHRASFVEHLDSRGEAPPGADAPMSGHTSSSGLGGARARSCKHHPYIAFLYMLVGLCRLLVSWHLCAR